MIDRTKKKPLTQALGIPAKSANRSKSVSKTSPEKPSSSQRQGRPMKLSIADNRFPLFQPDGLDDIKDPCPVWDGTRWHIFGSGGTVTTETWLVYHATAPALEGPWQQEPLIALPVSGSGVAAPGVVFADPGSRLVAYIIDIVFGAKPIAISLEAANPRHAHEWTVFERVKLPDSKVLIPGVIESKTNFIEHPEYVAERIQKVGAVEVRDANRPLKAGEEVYKAQCVACHGSGAAGAPKFGDAGAWGARIKQGFDTLVNSALKGKGAMGAQGGGDFSDIEISRAAVLGSSRRRAMATSTLRLG